MSDKYGRKPVIVITVLGSCVAYLIFGFANSIIMLFISRLLSGITGATIGVAQSYISEITSNEERSKILSHLSASFSLGFIFGPILSGLLVPYGYALPGIVASLLSVINFIMVILYLPETNKNTKDNSKFDLNKFKETIYEKEMSVLLLVQFISTFAVSNLFSTSPLLFHDKFQFNAQKNSYVFVYFGICTTIIQGFLVGKLSKKYDEIKLISLSCILIAIGMISFSYASSIISSLFFVTVIFLGNSIINPCLTSVFSKKASKKQIGVILGISQSLGSFARVLGPLWGGYVYYIANYHYPYISASIVSFIAFIIVLFMINNKKLDNLT
jgi:predicted MFS family arabinose efflux permease